MRTTMAAVSLVGAFAQPGNFPGMPGGGGFPGMPGSVPGMPGGGGFPGMSGSVPLYLACLAAVASLVACPVLYLACLATVASLECPVLFLACPVLYLACPVLYLACPVLELELELELADLDESVLLKTSAKPSTDSTADTALLMHATTTPNSTATLLL